MSSKSNKQSGKNDFSKQAEEKPPGLMMELWDFITNNKKWWLTPIILILVLVGGLVILAGTGFAPFIYTLF